jgi:hypothetical protein
VLDQAIRDALAKFDAAFGYAEGFDAASNAYVGLIYARAAPDVFGPSALLVRADVAKDHIGRRAATSTAVTPMNADGGTSPNGQGGGVAPAPAAPSGPVKPKRFYGSVEIDMARPVRSFDTILNAVILELQRTPGAKVKVTLEIEGTAPAGFEDAEVGIVRDNAKQLKFRAEATGFED